MEIPLSRAYISANELKYIEECLLSRRTSNVGEFASRCQRYFSEKYSFKNSILTTSCTDALEMSAILLNLERGDEIILPSYSFVSCALPFEMRGLKLVFADSSSEHPNINAKRIEELITKRTRAILIIHYAGVACDLDKIIDISNRHGLFLIEDAAHAINSFYKGKPLGSFGDLSTMSFHESKNISCGEGGLLIVNDKSLFQRAEIIRDKGTNRTDFVCGKVDKYNWIDIGSSFGQSEILAALLLSQLESLENIQAKRISIWNRYSEILSELKDKELCELPNVPDYASNNAHIFYLVCKSSEERNALIGYLKRREIQAAFHYQSLHSSPYFFSKHDGRDLINADKYSNRLVRLPIYADLHLKVVDLIADIILDFYKTCR